MRWRFIALGGGGLLLLILACLPAMASSGGGNCVAYARDVTGIRLEGNAASWWPHAEGRYERGHSPRVGAVLVFKPYAGMHVGHVAVVSKVLGPREVLVDQANWVRGRVTRSMSVIDASPFNDWTSVKVQYSGTHGRENPTYGFIYPRELPADFGATAVAVHDGHQRKPHAVQTAGRGGHGDGHHLRHRDTERADNGKAKHRVAANPPHHPSKPGDGKLAMSAGQSLGEPLQGAAPR